jgi:uncharacterized protein YdaU (DUF1376 family)
MHYYQFHIGDYRKDTAHLIPIEHYIYRSLIDWYFLDEKPIPKITQSVIRRLMLGSEYIANVENVLSDFFVLSDEGYRHKRIDKEIEEYHGKCVKNKGNGIKGGRPKKTQSVILNNPNETQNNPTVTLTINQEPLTKNQIKPSAAFALPDWINSDHWNLWLKTRKGKKLIPEQMQANVEKLEKWKIAGLDYGKALKDAADAGWQGLHEPNGGYSKTPKADNFETKDYGSGVNPL